MVIESLISNLRPQMLNYLFRQDELDDGTYTRVIKVKFCHELGNYEVWYRKIKAYNALNCDGELAGYKEGTEEGERTLIEESQYFNGKVSVKNFW